MKKIFLIFISLITTILLCEILLRIIIPFSSKLQYFTGKKYNITDTGFDNVEKLVSSINCSPPSGSLVNGFYTNSKGFMNKEMNYDNPTKSYRIVALGDSFGVAAAPYKYNYLNSLEKNLKKNFQENLELINLSVVCTGPKIYRDIFLIEGIKYEPNLVIVGVYVGNDFNDDAALLDHNPKVKSQKESNQEKLIYKSKLATLINSIIKYQSFNKNNQIFKNTEEKYGTYDEESVKNYSPFTPGYSESDYNDLLDAKLVKIFSNSSELYSNDAFFKEATNNLEEISKIAKEKNIRVLFVIIPDEMQLNDEVWGNTMNRNDALTENYDRFLPQKKLKEFFDLHNEKYIDLLPELQRFENTSILYQPRDTHFNSIGHQEISKNIEKFLLENNILFN